MCGIDARQALRIWGEGVVFGGRGVVFGGRGIVFGRREVVFGGGGVVFMSLDHQMLFTGVINSYAWLGCSIESVWSLFVGGGGGGD